MPKPLSFQQAVFKLQEYWANKGCLLWQPYNVQVGAGTMNPATYLRVLGPEPWNVVYVEPSIRPDDGRYGENPNRMQQFMQLQVILKPGPDDPQEQYLRSLEAIGIDISRHDIRFVEDNWQSPALGAWGLGWEVWLDGMEIAQFTYFQQAGGIALDPISVEITYGLERLVMYLQDKKAVWEIDYDERRTYKDVFFSSEVEQSIYNYDLADVERLTQMYTLFEAEAQAALAHDPPLVMPAHDYVLKCSHTFNLLDARGAVGVTERAGYFARMRDLARNVASTYLAQRQQMEYPWLVETATSDGIQESTSQLSESDAPQSDQPLQFVLEIGTEELPPGDLGSALEQLQEHLPAFLKEHKLEIGETRSPLGTPRRLALIATVAARQPDEEVEVKGPPISAAYDASGAPTKAALGFAKGQGIDVDQLGTYSADERYVGVHKKIKGHNAMHVLAAHLPSFIASIKFGKPMRWNASGIAFSRPIRWIVALLDDQVIPFEYAGVRSGGTTRGSRPAGSPEIKIESARDYLDTLKDANILVDPDARRAAIVEQINALAEQVGGSIPDDAALLQEVTHMVEQPTALLGSFDKKHLALPHDVLITVMKKHQRYFPIVGSSNGQTSLMPYFITIRNGGNEHADIVTQGNEGVLRARYADAEYFYNRDTQHKLEDYLPRLNTLTFQEKLGSMLDKARRIEALVPEIAKLLKLDADAGQTAVRAAHLCKADLVTQMVIELTSLQGIVGREYAKLSGEDNAVANAISEHYLPRFAGDTLPQSKAGMAIGLADRFDSLIGLFAIGLAPTGSADPWALRRAALGIVQMLIGKQISFRLDDALKLATKAQPVKVKDKTFADALKFICGRLRVLLLDQGYRHDAVDAVLTIQASDPYRAASEVDVLSKWMHEPDWDDVLSNFSRCARITRDLKEKLPLDTQADAKPATANLHAAYEQAAAKIKAQPDVGTLLTELRGLKDTIFTFFEDVMVNDENESLRRARQGLVQHIAALSEGIVDLSRVEGF